MVRPTNLQDIQFTGLRAGLAKFIENRNFSRFITFVILANAVTLGLETSSSMVARFGDFLTVIDSIALVIFLIEIFLKLSLYGPSFFRAGWNIFDFVIVSIALIPAIGPFSVLRTLRVLRVLRLVSVVPQMRRVIAALFHAIPGMASIMAVLLIIFYVASVLVTRLFGHEFEILFGSIGASMYTLFQIMTLEGWSEEVVRPVMGVYPWSWLFFIPFIIITSFAVLNLFIGIIVDAMNYVHDKPKIDVDKEVREIRKEIKAMRKLLEEKSS